MKMIEKIIRAMQDTGLIDGMSMEDCDTLATAALEELMSLPTHLEKNGYEFTRYFKSEFDHAITIAFEE